MAAYFYDIFYLQRKKSWMNVIYQSQLFWTLSESQAENNLKRRNYKGSMIPPPFFKEFDINAR